MTPEDIKKLPTPESDAEANNGVRCPDDNEICSINCSNYYAVSRSLEQRLAAAVMAAGKAYRAGSSAHRGNEEWADLEDAAATLESIRSMK